MSEDSRKTDPKLPWLPVQVAQRTSQETEFAEIVRSEIRKAVKKAVPDAPEQPQIDWEQQPMIPADRIHWGEGGHPIRVQFTLQTIIYMITGLIALISAFVFLYYRFDSHIQTKQIHLDPVDGVGWGETRKFVSREEFEATIKRLRELCKGDP